MKLRSIKNVTTFWFYNLSYCLRLYILHNRRIASPSLIALKDFIYYGNFIKIDRLLSVGRLLKYAPTIFTWSTNNSNKEMIVRNICSDFFLTIEEKVLLKSIFYICEKLCAKSFTLYWAIDQSRWYLTLNKHLDLTAFFHGRS